ncbi:MAG: porin family protein [Bacteroidia bacterium]
MKKIIHIFLSALLLLLLHVTANAQRFSAGITAGLVATDVHNSDIYDNDDDFHKAGFMLGGAVSTPLSEKITFRFELNYIQKGTQQPGDSLGNDFYRFSFNYLEFPLLVKYRIHFNVSKKPVKGFELHAGISYGKLLQNTAEGDNFFQANDDTRYNTNDVSLLGGLGYRFATHFTFTVRYSNSLISVFKQNSDPYGFGGPTFNNGNNMVFHFVLQLQFGAVPKNTTAPPAEENNSGN